MTKSELVEAIDDYNDGVNDVYCDAIHELEDDDMSMTVEDFLIKLLNSCKS